MSGIVAVLQLDGSPVEPGLIGRLTQGMSYRGPDEQGWWSQGPVALGFAGLHVFDDGGDRGQPTSLDGRYWIVADARIDAQTELRDKLQLPRSQRLTDAELILHAYRRWGNDALTHLLGDFSFVLWDAQEQTLLAASDRTGIRHLYWTQSGNRLLTSNSFRTLVEQGGAAREPDLRALADFLQHGHLLDADATFLKEVRHLAAAALSASRNGVRPWTYWEPGEMPRLRGMRDEDIVERLRELLTAAVRDRLRRREVVVHMSGGLDSTGLAAIAQEQGATVRALTVTHAPVVDDSEELSMAQAVAQHLGIGLEVIDAAGSELLEGLESVPLAPWPMWGSMPALWQHVIRVTGAASRLAFTGFDGDAALGLPSVSLHLLGLRDPYLMAAGLGTYLLYERRLPIVASLRRRRRPRTPPLPSGPVRTEWERPMPMECRSPGDWPLGGIVWRELMQDYDEMWAAPVEFSHPFADLRVVELGRSLPPIPWRVQKRILREVLRDRLPVAVLRRPKAPMPADPAEVLFQRAGMPALEPRRTHPALNQILDRGALERALGTRPPGYAWLIGSAHLAQRWFSLVA